jgi:hypothetical protein
MARRRRYYSDDDIERGITPSELKRAGRERQKEYMRHWFHRNFEDPVHETPYSSQEGGYLFIWGGPYDAREQLYDEFGSLVLEDRIEELADEIEGEDGIQDWAPGPDHPDTRQREEEWHRERGKEETRLQSETLDQIIDRLKSGVKPTYGDDYELEQRRAVRERLDKVKSLLAQVTPAHGGIGHNRPPPDSDSPQAVVIVELRDAEETINRELTEREPNALEVANATLRLQSALGWFAKKFDLAADSFAKGFGKTLGVVAATAAVAAAGLKIPSLAHLLAEIIQYVTQWLSYVTHAF